LTGSCEPRRDAFFQSEVQQYPPFGSTAGFLRRNWGQSGLLHKPVSAAEFMAAIREALP
jgi:hypothetical protein